jgi:hypothetical protein
MKCTEKGEIKRMKSFWTGEELDELHSVLYAFLSFCDESALTWMGKDKIGINHVSALKKRLDEMLTSHGGRTYLSD